MIKVPYSITELNALAAIYYKDIKAELTFVNALVSWPAISEIKPVMTYLHSQLADIIIGPPDVLENLIPRIEPLIAQAKIDYRANHPIINDAKGIPITDPKKLDKYLTKWAKDCIIRVFNYDTNKYTSFTGRNKGEIAYRHAKRLKINTCPYCNAQFTFTIKSKRGKSRPQFDHFLSKGDYPYFALSFFNLVPSCSTCNSTGLKGSKPFSIKTHLHPFIDNIEGLYQFRTKIKAVDFIVKGDKFDVLMRPCIGASMADKKRAKNSINSFAINDRYKFHKDYAEEAIIKAYFYNNSTIENLFTSFKIGTDSIFTSKKEIKELIMGNYLHPENFHRKILAKITKDVAEEFGLTL